MADLIVVNKSDSNLVAAKQAKQAYRNAVHLFPAKESNWVVKAMLSSAILGEGVPQVWSQVKDYERFAKENGYFETHRKTQAKFWFDETIKQHLGQLFTHHPSIKKHLPVLQKRVIQGEITPFAAADELMELFRR